MFIVNLYRIDRPPDENLGWHVLEALDVLLILVGSSGFLDGICTSLLGKVDRFKDVQGMDHPDSGQRKREASKNHG
jgi:hypothetical protein